VKLGEQMLEVNEVSFGARAEDLGDTFSTGQPLKTLTDKLLAGQVDPLNAPFLKLKCMAHQGRLLCADNKRLKCLKDYQDKVPQKVLVRVEVCESDREVQTFLEHFTNVDKGESTVIRSRSGSRPHAKGDAKGRGKGKGGKSGGGKSAGKGKDRGGKGRSKDGRRPRGGLRRGGKGRSKGEKGDKGKAPYEEDFHEEGYHDDGYDDGYRDDDNGQADGNGDEGWDGDQGYGDDQFYDEEYPQEGSQWDETNDVGGEPYDPEDPAR